MRTLAEWRKEKMDEEQKKRVEEIEKEGIGGKDGLHAWRNEKWLLSRIREQEKEIEQLTMKGTWPAGDLRRAFVEGAKWWEWISRHATMWNSDVRNAEKRAGELYPGGNDTRAEKAEAKVAEQEKEIGRLNKRLLDICREAGESVHCPPSPIDAFRMLRAALATARERIGELEKERLVGNVFNSITERLERLEK